ncbi:hypothetical protein [Streptomyces sp. NPDC000878]
MTPSGASNDPRPSPDSKSPQDAPAQKKGTRRGDAGRKSDKERAHRGVAATNGKTAHIGRIEAGASAQAKLRTPAVRISDQRGPSRHRIEHPVTGGGYEVGASFGAPESKGLGQRIRVSLRGVAGALVGLPLLPIDDAYDAGMLLAALLVLAVDVLIDLSATAVSVLRRFLHRFQVTEVVMKERNGDRVVRTEMTIRKRTPDAHKAGFVLRVIALVLLVTQELGELVNHHTALLSVAVGTVVLDVVIEISTMSIKKIKKFVTRIKILTIARADRDTESRN